MPMLKINSEAGEIKSGQAYQIVGTLVAMADAYTYSKEDQFKILDYFAKSDEYDPDFMVQPINSPRIVSPKSRFQIYIAIALIFFTLGVMTP